MNSGFVSHACNFAAPCNKFAAPVYRGTVSIGEMSKQTTQRCSRVRRTAEDARAAQARNTAARRAARAAAPVGEACAARARQTDAQRAARAAAPAEERRATQARNTAAHRAARAAAPAEERRATQAREFRTAEDARAAQARNTAAHRAARAAAPAEERRATQARDTAAHRAARAAAPAEERRATQARNTAAHRAARASHSEFRRAAGENTPSDAFLDNFDVDPVAALALHHALQYHWQGEDFRDADFNALDGQQLLDVLSMLDEEGLPDHIDVARRMKAYTCRVDPRQPVRGCGCCGEADVPAGTLHDCGSRGILSFTEIALNDGRLHPLWYTDAEKESFERRVPSHIEDTDVNHDLWCRFRNTLSQIEVNVGDVARRMHLYPDLVTEGKSFFCRRCITSLAKNERPPFSIAGGWDLGDPARAGLPELSFCEKLCVQRVRVLHAAMNIRVQRQIATYNVTRGHGIAYMQNGHEVCAAQLPSSAFALGSAFVCVQGPPGCFRSANLEGLIQKMGALRANTGYVVDWLTALYFVNGYYETTCVATPEVADKEVQRLRHELINKRRNHEYKDADDETKQAVAVDNVARQDTTIAGGPPPRGPLPRGPPPRGPPPHGPPQPRAPPLPQPMPTAGLENPPGTEGRNEGSKERRNEGRKGGREDGREGGRE